MTVKDWGDWMLFAAVVQGVMFLAAYTLLARWWESREGWYLWVSSLILALILGYNYAAVMGWFDLRDPAVRDWTRLTIYAGALVIMTWRAILLLMAQFQNRPMTLARFEPRHRRSEK